LQSISKFGAMTVLLAAAFAVPQAYGSRVALVTETSVRGESIYLSDLLPPHVSALVRTPALKLLIGTSPLPGSTRVLYGADIENLINGNKALGDIDVPARVVVRRGARPAGREEVLAAIRNALDSSGFSGAQVAPEDIHFSSAVTISNGDAKLAVRRMDFDSGLQQARFLVASRADLTARPFVVTAELHGKVNVTVASHPITTGQVVSSSDMHMESADANSTLAISNAGGDQAVGKRAIAPVVSGEALRLAQFDGVILVTPGKPVSLRLFSDSTEMLLDVIPLERGLLGDNIRVKLPGTGKILNGYVIGPGKLEARF